MQLHTDLDRSLFQLIRGGEIRCAGNQALKVYGTLSCKSGKRMAKRNRVFFSSAEEATRLGFRPCGHCMKSAYKQWKSEQEPG
ncbi:MAG: Ada metal-binding domain-containing protein [Bacteroidota bacterium]